MQLTSAQAMALYVFRIEPKRIMYTQPYSKLINEQIREASAEYKMTGSSTTPGNCIIARMVLYLKKIRQAYEQKKLFTYDNSSTETMFNVFHSSNNEPMNASHVTLRFQKGDVGLDGSFAPMLK